MRVCVFVEKNFEKLLQSILAFKLKYGQNTTHQIQMYLWNVQRHHTHSHILNGMHDACNITSTLVHFWISITAYLLRFRYQLITCVFLRDKIIELESTIHCVVCAVVVCCHFQCCRCVRFFGVSVSHFNSFFKE